MQIIDKKIIQTDENGIVHFGKYDLFIQFFIIYSVVTFSFETMPNLTEKQKSFFQLSEIFCVGFFTVEYLTRIIFSKNKPGYLFSFFGILDLVAILPFYLAVGVDLRSVRAFRLLRIFHILKLVRYSKAIRRIRKSFLLIKEELVLFGSVAIIFLYLSAVGIHYFEQESQPEYFGSVFQSLWWAVVTLTTVGYGDVYPITLGGRIFTFFVLIIGIGIIAIPSGLIASALSQTRREE